MICWTKKQLIGYEPSPSAHLSEVLVSPGSGQMDILYGAYRKVEDSP
jgi:hypothetical protein